MARDDQRIQFGIHGVTAFDPATGIPFTNGMAEVVGSGTLTTSSEAVKLFGGSQLPPYAVESTNLDTEFTIALTEYPDWFYEKVLGATVTGTAASSTGSVTSIANKSGTSVFDAATGIASVAVTGGDEADLKAGIVVVEAASATTVDLYLLTDVDRLRGTALTWGDDNKITSSPLTITGTGGTTAVADLGVTLTGGSGTVGMTTGDTAFFEIYPPHGGVSDILVGQRSASIPEVGLLVVAQTRATGEKFYAELFRAKATSGAPIPFGEKEFAQSEVTFALRYDSGRDGVYKLTAITPEA